MNRQHTRKNPHRHWPAPGRLGLLLLAALLLAVPAAAALPKHAPAAMDHGTDHAGEHAQHAAPAAPAAPAAQGAADHAGHAMPADQGGHVHPVADPAAADAVGLDEMLGSKIPLELTFRDEQGNPVSLAELVDGPTVIAPVYYRCPNVCHFLQGDLARVLPGLKLVGGQDYKVVSFSFDHTESPELAKRSRDTYYAAMKNRYPEQAWRFLTGDRETILKLTDAAGYRFKKVGHDFLHPVVFFVVAADGTIIRYLHGTHVLPKDLTLALYEAKSGQVGTTIRKMVQYCFSFDPEQKTYVFNLLRVSATAILATLAIFAAYLVFGGKKSKRE